MRCMLLFLVTLLKIGTLKTESIDFARKNGRMDMMYPLSDASKTNDAALHPAIKQGEGDSESREWNAIEAKFQPNEPLRKLINLDDGEEYETDEYEFPEDQFRSIEQLDDAQSARFSNYLIKLLQRPGAWEAPLILIKDGQDAAEARPFPLELEDGLQGISKRSRYYRRYPWKRQNSRSYSNMDYDPYNPCNPTKHDVFQLLVALHDARQGICDVNPGEMRSYGDSLEAGFDFTWELCETDIETPSCSLRVGRKVNFQRICSC